MSVGFQPTGQAQVNAKAGTVTLVLRNALRDIVTFKAWLDSQTDTQLQSLGYSPADITLMRNSFTDLKKLSDVANGQAQQVGNSNFFANAINLLGTE